MPKLYFRYGTVGCAKTLNLLAVAHNYRQHNHKVLLVKPEIDDRFGRDTIKARAGLSSRADIVVSSTQESIELPNIKEVSCILVDEVQFLPEKIIEQFHKITCSDSGVPIICYGLRTDFRCKIFPASLKLMELADKIEEVKTICVYCLKKAKFNLKLLNGKPTLKGPSVELGCEEKYLPVCGKCYNLAHSEDGLF
jgi:thymidine kinase